MKEYDNSYGDKYGMANGGSDKYVKKHNEMYMPKGMNLKDNEVAPKVFKCTGDKTMYPKNKKM